MDVWGMWRRGWRTWRRLPGSQSAPGKGISTALGPRMVQLPSSFPPQGQRGNLSPASPSRLFQGWDHPRHRIPHPGHRIPHPDTASLIPQPLSTIPEPSSIRPITQSPAIPNPPSAPRNHNSSRRSPEAPGLTRTQGFFGKRLVQGKGMKEFSPDIRMAGVKRGNLVGKMSQPRAQLSIPRFSLAFLRPPQHSQAFLELSPAFSHDKQGNGPERVTREGCCVQTPTVPPGIDSRFSNPVPVLEKMSCRMRGRRVTIPEPRGRKSLEGMKRWVNK